MTANHGISELYKSIKSDASASKRYPVSVYRLQFSAAFKFKDAAGLIPYLHDLGITDCYASPYFKARPGSPHGYDVSDHNALNPELGTEEDYLEFVRQLKKFGMGQILDIVPNHSTIFDNPKWQDVLENGPSSKYARFFDIDWDPVKPELHNKVLLPILDDFYGNLLEKGEIRLGFDNGAFLVECRNNKLPVDPGTVIPILDACLHGLEEEFDDNSRDFMELQSVLTACRNLPDRQRTDEEGMAERHREKEIIKGRLAELCSRNMKIRTAVDRELQSYNGHPGKAGSFRKLHYFLEAQAYRLSYWRVAADEINYRRFFDVNELVALRVEDPVVFEETHRLVRSLLAQGVVTGLRVDHIDGLFDPQGYLQALQEARWVDFARNRMNDFQENPDVDESLISELQARFQAEQGKNPHSDSVNPVFIIVEKILCMEESLRPTWPVNGTTGYEFAAALNNVFINRRRLRAVSDVYQWFTRSHDTFQNIAYESKNKVMMTSMASEINLLANGLNRVSERSWQHRDFTLNSLRDAIREVIACFPVYRTYIDAYRGSLDENDRSIVNKAVADARRRNPAVNSAIFDFIRNTLLLEYPVGMDETGRNEQRLFVMHFQQFTGPVMAKGVEDTAFYVYNPLVSLNEVGGNMQPPARAVKAFQELDDERSKSGTCSFSSTSTHDSKRGEDVRARIDVLSEIPDDWKAALTRWRRFNSSRKTKIDGVQAPDSNEEYLIYQTLLGTYPVKTGELGNKAYISRIQEYTVKALREAKIHTSWINPNSSYEEAVVNFIAAILDRSPSNRFLADFSALNNIIATCGMYNSLSQTVLKLFSPGVPDIYQGNELLAFNLTDPDNRRPVDFAKRRKLLNRLKKDFADISQTLRLVRNLTDNADGNLAKLYITWRSLTFRRDNPDWFDRGEYIPLNPDGSRRRHICAFALKKGRQLLVVAAPRLPAQLTGGTAKAPVGAEVWRDTAIILPARQATRNFRNIFTGEIVAADPETGKILEASSVFNVFPVAVFEPMHPE